MLQENMGTFIPCMGTYCQKSWKVEGLPKCLGVLPEIQICVVLHSIL